MKQRCAIQQIADGFFTAAPVSPEQTASPFQFIHAPGLPVQQVQFCRLSVADEGALGQEHLQLMVHYPPLPPDACAALAQYLGPRHPQAVLSFVQVLSEGYAEATADAQPRQVAAALTESMRGGSWDESPVFRIIVGSQSYHVTIHWVKDHAEAEVEEAG